ncbi:3' terminal RNA ribose 2'-O-methyltransferase Hen1 [Paeniglutamicibacter kerguelensis]|uniref:Small RNA 2'-O-methyltransferase n=1 Tax=Paeniglutamicibacter kerguelensis TaxID=254788 RepID=A0ABS4X9M0_9MICC|nr:3' terminal RNA ribose 2'-O-methyltransferase Hen1 [Paeniglutamicibacter kerguelensis]MBP2385160.1 3' terminal RNA ribose 2'-O-methyltransferase Hen1 [Paeniglutamicibacter kerguelensis]
MLITITLEPENDSQLDATALSHLLRKHPGRLQTFELSVGNAHVFYPEYSPERTTAALLLEVDAVGLVRNKRFRGDNGALDYYINDRPFTASSLLAVAMGKVLRSAMTETSEAHPELVGTPLPLRLEVPVISTRGNDGKDLVRRLFAPLGWAIEQTPIALDDAYPLWEDSRYSSLVLTGTVPLNLALRQLYVLLPVLDDSKHYWVNDDEAEKLVRHGEGWLPDHPERALISHRYLAHQKDLVEAAEARIAAAAPVPTVDPAEPAEARGSTAPPLRVQRAEAVIAALKDCGAHHVVDVGSGPGALLRRLQKDSFFTRILGTDVSAHSLEQAAKMLNLDELADADKDRIKLLHSSAVYRDERIAGFDAVVLMEVVEHIEPSRLPALEDSIFAGAAPRSVIVTTPNSEFNRLYPALAAGTMRHEDHRFEWTRAEFAGWADAVAARHGYGVEYRPVGEESASAGPATQMAIFRKVGA